MYLHPASRLIAPALLALLLSVAAGRAETVDGCVFTGSLPSDPCGSAAGQKAACLSTMKGITPAHGPQIEYALKECVRCSAVYLARRCGEPSAEASWPVPTEIPEAPEAYSGELSPPTRYTFDTPVETVAAAPEDTGSGLLDDFDTGVFIDVLSTAIGVATQVMQQQMQQNPGGGSGSGGRCIRATPSNNVECNGPGDRWIPD